MIYSHCQSIIHLNRPCHLSTHPEVKVRKMPRLHKPNQILVIIRIPPSPHRPRRPLRPIQRNLIRHIHLMLRTQQRAQPRREANLEARAIHALLQTSSRALRTRRNRGVCGLQMGGRGDVDVSLTVAEVVHVIVPGMIASSVNESRNARHLERLTVVGPILA